MGSVIDSIECPNCQQEAMSDFYYKTGEQYVHCQNCGYLYSGFYKRGDDGNPITKDGSSNYSFDNLIFEEKEVKNPYGAFRVKPKDAIATQCGSFENEQEFLDFKESILERKDEIESCTWSRYDNGEIITETLVE